MLRGKQPNSYQPLLDHLANSTANEVTLTFREIEVILNRPLPKTAILLTGWWSNPSRPHTRTWRARGWRARADRDHLRVVFTREERAMPRPRPSKYQPLADFLTAQ